MVVVWLFDKVRSRHVWSRTCDGATVTQTQLHGPVPHPLSFATHRRRHHTEKTVSARRPQHKLNKNLIRNEIAPIRAVSQSILSFSEASSVARNGVITQAFSGIISAKRMFHHPVWKSREVITKTSNVNVNVHLRVRPELRRFNFVEAQREETCRKEARSKSRRLTRLACGRRFHHSSASTNSATSVQCSFRPKQLFEKSNLALLVVHSSRPTRMNSTLRPPIPSPCTQRGVPCGKCTCLRCANQR